MQNIVMAANEFSLEKTELIPPFFDLFANYLPIGFNSSKNNFGEIHISQGLDTVQASLVLSWFNLLS